MYGCDEGVSMLEGAYHTGKYHSMSVVVVEGHAGHSNDVPWNPAFHHQGVRVSLIRREPAKT